MRIQHGYLGSQHQSRHHLLQGHTAQPLLTSGSPTDTIPATHKYQKPEARPIEFCQIAAMDPKQQRVGTKEEHDDARRRLLEAEKQLVAKSREVADLRRQLPWVRLEHDYHLEGRQGRVSLSSLFPKDGKKDLVVVHFMFDAHWNEPCEQCSCWAESNSTQLPFFLDRFNFAVVAKAPFERLEALGERKGWRFAFYSSAGSSFNRDFGVEETEEGVVKQKPGISVFRREEGVLYHTYTAHARQLEGFNSVSSSIGMRSSQAQSKLQFPALNN